MNAISISAMAGEMKRRLLEDSSSLGWLFLVKMPDIMRSTVPFPIAFLAWGCTSDQLSSSFTNGGRNGRLKWVRGQLRPLVACQITVFGRSERPLCS